MAYSPETPFEDLSEQQKIHHLFDVAYDVATYTQADDYSERDFEDLQAWSQDSLAEFGQKIMAIRHTIHAHDIDNKIGLHVVNPHAYLAGNFYHVEHPLITYTVDALRGFDSRGYNVIADRLTIFDKEDPADVEIAFTRMNYGSPNLQPLQLRYPAALLTSVCARLETIIAE